MKKLNYLIVMPRVIADGTYAFALGIPYISAAMKQAGFTVFTTNLNHIATNIEEYLQEKIKDNNIDVVMIGGFSFQYENVKTVIDAVKKNHPAIKIIVGGTIITGDPVPAMTALEYVDIGVIGEGEVTAVELAHCLENNGDISTVAGIIYQTGGGFTVTSSREEIKDLDSIPFPDYEGFALKKYFDEYARSTFYHKRTPINILGSRNCPYRCTFCFHKQGAKYRQRSVANIMAEIKYIKDNYADVNYIELHDELFSSAKERVREFVNALKAQDIFYYTDFRLNDIDEEMIGIIKTAGNCVAMTVGIESADNRILKSMKKNLTVEQIERGLAIAHNAGIRVYGYFIIGDIAETVETAKKTLDWWDAHPEYQDSIVTNFVFTYPGTEIYRQAVKNGIIKDPVQYLKDACPQVNISKMSDEEMAYIARRVLGFSKSNPISKQKLISLADNGTMTIEGSCALCRTENVWNNARILSGFSWCVCKKCGHKHISIFPSELLPILGKSIHKLMLNNRIKIAFWGITWQTIDIFATEGIFKNESIIFVDSAAIKQCLLIDKKKVYAPQIIRAEEIATVVFCYPGLYEEYAKKIPLLYPSVKKVVNIIDLLYDAGEPK